MLFIGDIHGKFSHYWFTVEKEKESIQVGDYGVGFGANANPETDELSYYGPFRNKKSGHKFIRGNHDNPEACRANVNWIPDATMHGNVFCIGGAYSIDVQWRTPGIDWWEDEELSYGQFIDAIDLYADINPDFVVSHDLPITAQAALIRSYSPIESRTNRALDNMFHLHRPKVWVFGHHHQSIDEEYMGTRFVCLKELETKRIDTGN